MLLAAVDVGSEACTNQKHKLRRQKIAMLKPLSGEKYMPFLQLYGLPFNVNSIV
jgi:hypothetical protein